MARAKTDPAHIAKQKSSRLADKDAYHRLLLSAEVPVEVKVQDKITGDDEIDQFRHA